MARWIGLWCVALPVTAWAQDAAESEEAGGIGLNADVEISSAYIFRGLNIFASEGQMDIHPLLAPSLTWTPGDSGFNIGTWWAFQLAGPNRATNVEGGVGNEMDLYAAWDDISLVGDALTVTPAVYGYIYPFAAGDAAFSTWLEPQAAFNWYGAVDASLLASWMMGVQDSSANYFYLAPSVGKGFDLSDTLSGEAGAAFGYKLFKGGNEGADNVMDAQVNLSVCYCPAAWYVQPAVHVAWTDFQNASFSDGIVAWGGVNVGADF